MPSYYHRHTTTTVHILGPKGPPFSSVIIFRVYTRLIKSKSHRHYIICCHHLQIPPSSAAPSAASSAIFQASYYTGILSPFVANFPCQGIMFIHDSIPGPIDRGIEGYVIDDRPSQDRCPHLSRGDRGNCLTHK